MTQVAYIDGIGLLGPGLPGWKAARLTLAGREPYVPGATVVPPASLLPPAERRRSGAIVKLALCVGLEAVTAADVRPQELSSVFSSSGGDGDNCHAICEMLAGDDRLISPTRFHNSVHNAASGYWSIATGAMTPSSVLSAYDASFGAGLLESLAQVAMGEAKCLLVAADTAYPEPLHGARPIPDAFGIALVLARDKGPNSIARLSVTLTEDPGDQIPEEGVEALRRSIPAARGLPLLRAIAAGGQHDIVLDYLDSSRLAVTVASC